MDRELISVPQPPHVVSLLPSATEMLGALGVSPLAVSHECDFPAAVRSLPRATFSHVDSQAPSAAIDDQVRARLASSQPLYGIKQDLIVELRPEVIVTQAQCDVCAVRHSDVLELVACQPDLVKTKVVALNPSSLAEVLRDMLHIGVAVGKELKAQQVVHALQSRIDLIASRLQSLPTVARPRTSVIEWTSPLMTAGNWTPELVALAGGQNCLSEAGKYSGCVTWDAIADAAPEVLIIAPCGYDLARSLHEAEAVRLQAGWADLPAVRNGRVFAIDGNQYLNRSGPRLVETVEILAHLLQPQLFPPPRLADAFRRVP